MIPLEPSRFRSPLLEALPTAAADRDRRSLRLRRGLVALVVVVLAASVALIKTRWLSIQGPGYGLYWFHDTVYLPLKGRLFTWLFPVSWVYLLAVLSLMVFGLVAVVWKRPLTPAWQARVGRWLLSRRRIRPLMRGWNRAFKRVRGLLALGATRVESWPRLGPFLSRLLHPPGLPGPTLLDEVAEHEREAVLGRLDALDPRDDAAVENLARATELTIFSARATAPFVGHQTDPESLLAVTRLNQVLLRLELICALVGDQDELEELRVQLESEIAPRLRPFLALELPQPGFALPSLVADLALLLGFGEPPTWKAPKPGKAHIFKSSRQRIIQGILIRRRMLDAGRRQLERWSSYGQRRRRGPSTLDLEIPSGALEARLSVDLVLLVALRFALPRGALAFLESLEGLRFVLLLVGGSGRLLGERANEETSQMEVFLSAVERLPQAFDYRVCSGLLSPEQASLEQATDSDLAEAIGRRSKVVSRSDLELIEARRAELRTAAADS